MDPKSDAVMWAQITGIVSLSFAGHRAIFYGHIEDREYTGKTMSSFTDVVPT
ncbi:hypothetical protein B0H14DRAFT_3455918 [Mycena olivaceomarginata]|nr:hypothetical protein B0H14DRAFT_3488525 [Mycena olivaceomarginata]KAJ7843741.1 hypothetical protein B0H14DRAFT_3455918 [Mycena olivaceomarginata]